MQNVLRNFISAPNEKGNILLVNMPPGTGKTFASSNAIARHVRSGDPRRVIFITPYKKNLPLDTYDAEGNRIDGELRKAFAREGIPELYDEYVINLQPVAEHVLRAGAEMLRNGDAELLRSFLDDRRLYNEIEAHFRLALEQGGSKKQFDMMVENFRLLENQLRRRIHRRLDSVGGKASERHQYIVDELPWLRDLYPEVDVYEKKVILLSSSKFIYPFDPIIAQSGSFYESDLLKDSVIFMDEFDSIKLDWLNNLVNRDNRRRIDLVNLYTRIHRGLMNRGNHVRQYYRDADAGKDGFAEKDNLASIADSVAEAFDTDFDTHNLQYDFKLMDEGPGGFIFHDYNTITIGRSSKMDIETDGDERINGIVYREGKKGVSGIEVMFRDLDRRIRYFEGFVSRMARNYMENRSLDGSPVTYEHAICTVLEPYMLDVEQVDYLVEAVMFRSGKRRLKTDRSDMTVYARGFNYYDFEDDETHGLNTRIHQTAYYRSPEAVLLRVLDTEGVKVIGVSATATLRTCVRNFDLRYLSYQSAFREYTPSEEEIASLDAAYAKAMEHYGDVNIVPIIIGTDHERCFENSRNVLKLFNLDLMKESPYDRARYGRFAMAYRQFVRNADIRSMLCFMTALPSKYGGLREDVLRRICNAILVDEALDPTDSPFEVLRTEEFGVTKDRIIQRLSTGEKVFVVTTYQTVGAGQNLQYPKPEGVETVRVNGFVRDGVEEKDFDAVYLDRPTNILPTTFEEGEVDQLARYLFDVGFLQAGNEITIEDSKRNIRAAFNRFTGSPNHPSGFMETDSVRVGAVRDIEQAVGRMCRTNCKSPTVYVMADAGIAEFMANDISDYGTRLNREFEVIYSKLHAMASERSRERRNGMDQASDRARNMINRLVGFPWNTEGIGEWTSLRDRLLRRPTSPEGEGGNLVYGMYCQLPEPSDCLAYREDEDDGPIYICGDDLDKEVSAEAARLPELMSIPWMREFFEARGYATTFEPNVRIMCPRLFKNVYKGALGEVAGRFILGQWGIGLNEIDDPSRFERFDFVAEDGTYVDFKHWQGTPLDYRDKDETTVLDRFFGKLSAVGGTRAVIINVLKPGTDVKPTEQRFERDGMVIWTIPYLYDGPTLNTEAYRAVKEIFG